MKKPDPNRDNEWLDLATERVAMSMVDWLKNTVNAKKPICALSKLEMKALAGNAIAQYEVEKSRRPETQRPYPDAGHLLV